MYTEAVGVYFYFEDKDDKLYQFVSRESNRHDISDYLRMIGFDVILEEKTGVCMLVAVKRMWIRRFEEGQCSDVFYVAISSFAGVLGSLSGEYRIQRRKFCNKGDLIDKIRSYDVQLTRTELNAAFRLFKKYSLINFNDDEGGEDMMIQLYPSLQFGWDLPQFQTVAREYLKDETENIAETEDEIVPENLRRKKNDPAKKSAADQLVRVFQCDGSHRFLHADCRKEWIWEIRHA